MAIYTVTLSNWNTPAFWSGINQGSGGHDLDFSALPDTFSVDFDEASGILSLSDGTTTFTVGDAVSGGGTDASLGGTTEFRFFETLIGSAGDDTIDAIADADSVTGGGGDDSIIGGAGDDTIRGDDLNGGYTVTPTGPNLIVNGSFEDLTGTSTTGYGAVATGSLTGWTAFNPSDALDLHNDGKGGTFATDGSYVLDTGASPTNLDVFQDVSGLPAGQTAVLTLDAGDVNFAPTNMLEIYFGGELVGVIDPEPGTMESYEIILTGGMGDGSDQLRLREVGEIDNHGVQLDNLQLFAATITETGGDDTISGDAGDDNIDGGSGDDLITGGLGDDDILGGAGDDEIIGDAGDDLMVGGTGDDILRSDETGASGSTPGTDSTPQELIGRWDFDDADDPLNDEAELDNSAILRGDATYNPTTGAVDLDGSGDFIEIPHDPTYDLASATVRIVATLDTIPGRTGLFSRDSTGFDGGGHFTLWAQPNGALELRWQSDSDSYTVTTPAGTITPGTEHDIQVSFDSGAQTINISVDGTQVASAGSIPVTLSGNAEPWVLGGNQWTSGDGVADNVIETADGSISLFEIYDGAYDAGEIDSISNGQDTVMGGEGDDTIFAGSGDIVDGGEDPDDTDIDVLQVANVASVQYLDDAGNPSASVTENGVVTFTDGTTMSFSNIEALRTDLENFIVEGTDGDEVIDAGYAGDPDGDFIDANDNATGDNDDSVRAGGGNDEVSSGEGADSVDAGSGNDTVFAGAGDDTVLGGAGADSVDGNEGADSLIGGIGDDTLNGGTEDDYLEGGADNDSLIGERGDDTMLGGAGDDFIRGSFGEDSIEGGTGDDYLWGGFGDDTIVMENGFGNDTIEGEEEEETTGDVLDFSSVTDDLTIDLTEANPEAGTVTDGVSTAEFVEIENIVLGQGTDTVVLGDFGGADFVQNFTGPIDNGDGTFTGVDQLDVSGLTSDFGFTPVNALDVTVTDDGSGNAVLTFPGGESITLDGIDPVVAANPAYLVALGVPSNEIVDGTDGDDSMGLDYVDSEGDQTDGTDGLDDTIFGYGGDDTILGGAGADTIDGGDDNDDIDGGIGADSIEGGFGTDTITGGSGADFIAGEEGDDSLSGGADADTLIGGFGEDTIVLDGGDDTAEGQFSDDTFQLTNATGNATITGGEDGEVDGDTLDLSNVTEDLTLDLTELFPESGTVSDGTNTTEFSEIENIILGGGNDTLILADGSGSDIVEGFRAPTVNPDGSLSAFDRLDVSRLNSDLDGTTPVNTSDVTVVDDGSGNAQLIFPNGESLTLLDIPPAAVTPAFLVAVGVPRDGVVSGDATDNVIDLAYTGDPDGDLVDSADGLDDTIQAGDGDDSIFAGAGDDTVFGEGDDDTIDGGTGSNTLIGGEGDDVFIGGAGADSLVGDGGNDIVDYSASGAAVNVDIGNGITEGGDAANDTLGFGIEGVTGSDFDDTLAGGDSTDLNVIDGGAGNDAIDGRGGADSLIGGTGDDTIVLGEGDDTALGGDDADTFILDSDGDGDDVNLIDGGSGGDDRDTLDFTNVTGGGVDVTLATAEDGTATWEGNSVDFTDIERIDASGNGDTIDASAVTDAVTLDGAGGDDSLVGGSADDTLIGGTGGDTLDASAGGDDLLQGGDDADTFTGAGQGDTVAGGDGGIDDDTLDLGGTAAPGGSLTINRDGPDSDGNGFDGTVTYRDATGAITGTLTFTNIENFVPCFTPGTLIKTANGERPVEALRPGDQVLTRDNGYQTIRWVGLRKLDGADLAAHPELQPVRLRAGCLGPNMPDRDMVVSPQHRLLLGNTQTELWFGEEEVLVAAVHMTCIEGVDQLDSDSVTYVHILFDQHELVVSDGTWTESFQPADMTLSSMDDAQREEIFAIFPELREDATEAAFPAARVTLKAHEAQVFLLS